MRVADVGTHVHCSLPGGRSRVRPWRFITKTSHFSGVSRCATSLIQLAEDRKSTRSELQSRLHLVCRLLLEKKKIKNQMWMLSSLTQSISHTRSAGQILCSSIGT